MSRRSGSPLNGWGHRLISMFPGFVCVLATSLVYRHSGGIAEVSALVGALLLTGLGFLSPLILTEGFNKPIPSSAHLELGSKGFRTVLLVLGLAFMVAPSILRLATRLLGAA